MSRDSVSVVLVVSCRFTLRLLAVEHVSCVVVYRDCMSFLLSAGLSIEIADGRLVSTEEVQIITVKRYIRYLITETRMEIEALEWLVPHEHAS